MLLNSLTSLDCRDPTKHFPRFCLLLQLLLAIECCDMYLFSFWNYLFSGDIFGEGFVDFLDTHGNNTLKPFAVFCMHILGQIHTIACQECGHNPTHSRHMREQHFCLPGMWVFIRNGTPMHQQLTHVFGRMVLNHRTPSFLKKVQDFCRWGSPSK